MWISLIFNRCICFRLLDCVLLCLMTLRHLSPTVTELVCDRELDVESWQPLLEPSLSAPSVLQPGQRPLPPILKLGTLLAAVNVFAPSVVAEVTPPVHLAKIQRLNQT